MKKVLKISLLVLFILFVLIITLPYIFRGRILKEVIHQVNDNLNAKVEIGSLDVGIIKSFPNLNIQIENITVTNNAEFDSAKLLSVKTIQINLDIMSIIKGEKYTINKILLEEPQIYAIIDTQGKANWDIVKTTADSTPNTEKKVDTGETKFSLALKKLSIEKANLVFNDKKGNSYYEATNLNYSLSGDLSSDITTLVNILTIDKTNAKFGGVKYLSDAKIDFTIDVEADLKNQKYTLVKNSFKVNALELQLDGWIQMLKNSTMDMDIKFNVPKISFKNLLSLVPAIYNSSFKDMQANGKIVFDGWVKGKKDSLHLPKFLFNLEVDNANFKYPSLPKAVNNIFVKAEVKNNYGNLDSTVINLKKLHLEMESNKVDAKVIVKTPTTDPFIDGNINADVNLKTLKDFVPLPDGNKLDGILFTNIKLMGTKSMIDKKQYDKFKAEGILVIKNVVYNTPAIKDAVNIKEISLGFSPKKILLNNFDAKIGQSDLNANGSIANFLEYLFKKDNTLVGTFNLSSTYLNSGSFISEDTTKIVKTAKQENTKVEPTKVIEVPGNIDFSLNTHIKKLVHSNIIIENIDGKVQVKDKKLFLHNLGLNILDGTIKVNGLYNTQNIKKPSVNMDLMISKIDIQKATATFNTVKEIAPYLKECFGKISCNINLQTLLTDTMSPVMSSLYSKGKVNTHGLLLKGENTSKLADLLKNKNLQEIAVNDMELRYTVKDGNLIVDTSKFSTGNIKGLYSIIYGFNKTIDALVKTMVPFETIKSQVITPEVENLLKQAKNNDIPISLPENITINLAIKGKSTSPNYQVSIDRTIFDNLKGEIEKGIKTKINKEKERLINEAKKEVEKNKDQLIEKGKNELKKLLPKW